MKDKKLGFIGCGNMARALIDNFLRSNMLKGLQITASDINTQALNALKENGVKIAKDNAAVVKSADILFVAVKPAHSTEVFKEIAPFVNGDKIIVSIMAGVPISVLKAALPKTKKFVRCMPNMAAKVGKGMTGVAFEGLADAEQSEILRLFESAGRVAVVREDLLDTVTAISGSGSAYVYMFIKALADAAAARGMSQDEARLFAAQTASGGAEMVLNSSESIENMVAAVCSKGGTTIEAVNVFNNSDFAQIIDNAVAAAYQKSKQMSQAFKI